MSRQPRLSQRWFSPPLEPRRVRYRLVHVFYAVAVLAAALATFGAEGIVPAAIVVAFWAIVFAFRSRVLGLSYALLVPVLGGCCISVLLPVVSFPPEASPRSQCSYNLKQIGLALLNYHDTYGSLPPAYLADQNGKPMHSWRVLILPFLAERSLYDAYDFDEPWNGPHNRKLATSVPRVYQCFSNRSQNVRDNTSTSYLAVVGPQTAWPGATSTRLSDYPNGTKMTIVVVEESAGGVNWMEPRDLKYDEAPQLLGAAEISRDSGHYSEDFFTASAGGRNILMADGSVSFVEAGRPPLYWDKLLRIDQGLPRTFVPDERQGVRHWQWKFGNCFRLGIFVMLVIYPLPWVWIRVRRAGWPSLFED